MRLVIALAICLALTGCTFLTGVEATPEPCTLARAGADTASSRLVTARGDTVAVVSAWYCRP